MFCKNCGKQIDDDSSFCRYCGQKQSAEVQNVAVQSFDQQPPSPATDELEKKKDTLSGEILKWGIMSLAFAQSFWLSFIGIIFYAKMKKRAKKYSKLFGDLTGRASVGHGLGTAGLIVGIILTVIFAIYLMTILFVFLISFLNFFFTIDTVM